MTSRSPSRPTGSFGFRRGGSRSGPPSWLEGMPGWGPSSSLGGQEPARMVPKVYIGGKLYEKADAKISVFDHGLLYGDGVFEGIRSYSGRVFRLAEHVDRLYDSARSIHLP